MATSDQRSAWSNSLPQVSHNFEFTCVNFALFNIDEEKEDCDLKALSRSQLQGWGSNESRTSYQCLASLVTESITTPRQTQSLASPGEEWGYFTDP